MKKQITHASVFSGIGGAEVAATMLGWRQLFHCEINPFGRQVLDYWYPNSKSYEDITTTDFTEWRGRVDVLTGGFPCQPFSYAGRRRGAEDDRYLCPTVEDVKKMARELLENAFDTRQKYPDFFSTTRYTFTAVATDEDMELIYHPLTSIGYNA